MKRLAQLFVSVLFVLTVSTVYFAFDLAVTSMIKPKKYSLSRHDDHRLYPTSTLLTLTSPKALEGNVAYQRTNSTRRRYRQGKPAPFHKSRTGVKINTKQKQKSPNKLNNSRPSV